MPQRITKMSFDDVAIMSLAHKTTWGGGLTAVAASMAQWNWAAVVATTVALGGFFVNWYYRHRKDQREAAESAARIAALQKSIEVNHG